MVQSWIISLYIVYISESETVIFMCTAVWHYCHYILKHFVKCVNLKWKSTILLKAIVSRLVRLCGRCRCGWSDYSGHSGYIMSIFVFNLGVLVPVNAPVCVCVLRLCILGNLNNMFGMMLGIWGLIYTPMYKYSSNVITVYLLNLRNRYKAWEMKSGAKEVVDENNHKSQFVLQSFAFCTDYSILRT